MLALPDSSNRIKRMTSHTPNVEFWFDPSCPWCWMTSRWANEVAGVRGFEIRWHPISLTVINEGNPNERHAEAHRQGHRAGRVIEAARRSVGEHVVGALYTEIGQRVHPGARSDMDAVIAEALAALGLDASLAEAADAKGDPRASEADAVSTEARLTADELDTQLRANTAHALKLAGPDVGVPIIAIDGVAFFGPVVTPAPSGEQALQLWDGIYAAASVPGFYELKRGRSADPQF